MKNKKLLLCIAIAAAVLICAACVAMILHTPQGWSMQFPSFEYDYSKPVESFDDGIVIDGKLDEPEWSQHGI